MPTSSVRQIIRILVATNFITYGFALTLIHALRKQEKRNVNLCEMLNYMVVLFEKYDVPLTEFDAIAISEMAREHNASE